jgi:hypothetical protein
MELYVHSPNTSSWRGAQLSTGITLSFTTPHFLSPLFPSYFFPLLPTASPCFLPYLYSFYHLYHYFSLSFT